MSEDVPSLNPAVLTQVIHLQNKVHGGATWFFIVAVLSLINTVIFLSGGNLSFVIGLGITQLIDGVATAVVEQSNDTVGTVARVIAIGLDLGMVGVFMAIGYFARRRYQASFIAGMIVYGIDALIMLPFSIWVGLIFHLLGLAGMWGGFQAVRRLKQLEQSGSVLPENLVLTLPQTNHVQTVRDRKYWVRMVAAILILLLPLFGFLLFNFLYPW